MQTNTVTPDVLEINLEEHFLRPDEAMTEIWQKFVLPQIKSSLFEKNIQLTCYQTECEISIYRFYPV